MHKCVFVHAILTMLSYPKQEAVKAAIIEEQKRSERAMEEAVKRTRDELVEYVREQRRVSVLCGSLLCTSSVTTEAFTCDMVLRF